MDLDGTLGDRVKGVTCDMDGTRLDLNFKHRADAMEVHPGPFVVSQVANG